MNQKEEEKLVMSLFRTNLEEFPKGKLVASESPDFILKVGRHRSIGIELSRLAYHQDGLIKQIKIALEKKTEKLIIYQKNVFNQIWLILYLEEGSDFSPEKITEISIDMDHHRRFDRVFLLDIFTGKIFEINVN